MRVEEKRGRLCNRVRRRRLTERHLGDDGRRHLQPITGAVGIGSSDPEQVLFVFRETLRFEVHVLQDSTDRLLTIIMRRIGSGQRS